MPIYQLFMLVSLSFVKKAKRANFLNFCKQILPLCIVSLNSCVRVYIRAYECVRSYVYAPVCVRVVRVRAVYPIILPYFKGLFYNSLIFNHL